MIKLAQPGEAQSLLQIADENRQLRAELSAREAEVTRLREIIADHERRADAARDTADRRMRVNDLAARYAVHIAMQHFRDGPDVWKEYTVRNARALAEAVVEAEQ